MESDFTQFIQQPFVGPVLGLLGFFTILLVLVLALLFIMRRRRARQRNTGIPTAKPEPNYGVESDSADMPDLDVLVSHLPGQPTASSESLSAPPAAPARIARKGTFTVTISDGGTTEAVEVMTVLRDVVEGKLVVQMGDRIYQNINNDAEFKDRFTRLMRELAQVAKPVTSAPPSVEAVPEQPAVPQQEVSAESEMPAASEAPEKPAAEVLPEIQPPAPRVYAAPPVAPRGEIPGDLPRFSLDDQGPIKPTRAQRREAKPIPEINIAAAIEAYLQHKLRSTPDFNGHSIHIHPAPDSGVMIEVDGQFFDSVGDVTDPDVRGFLQTAIQEWQDRA